MSARTSALAWLLLCATAARVDAAGLRVTPLRLDLAPKQNSAQIELTNFASGAVPVQIQAFTWRQVDGQDQYEPTRDIFFAPPIVSVPASGKAVVRFRLRGAVPADVERSYRVYFQEVAPPQPTSEGGMAFRLRLGVPLFVAPAKSGVPRLEIAQRAADGRLQLTLANRGTAHLKIQGLEVYPLTVDRRNPSRAVATATHSTAGANYLLPGSQHEWSVALPGVDGPGGHVVLLRTNDYSGRAAPGMTSAGWLWLPVASERAHSGRDAGR